MCPLSDYRGLMVQSFTMPYLVCAVRGHLALDIVTCIRLLNLNPYTVGFISQSQLNNLSFTSLLLKNMSDFIQVPVMNSVLFKSRWQFISCIFAKKRKKWTIEMLARNEWKILNQRLFKSMLLNVWTLDFCLIKKGSWMIKIHTTHIARVKAVVLSDRIWTINWGAKRRTNSLSADLDLDQ